MNIIEQIRMILVEDFTDYAEHFDEAVAAWEYEKGAELSDEDKAAAIAKGQEILNACAEKVEKWEI